MTEPPHVAAVRESYDTVAAEYARRYPIARVDPVARAMLGAFAEIVHGPVADLGCGPGRVTAFLAERGASVSGVDVSPEMVLLARRAYPHLRFSVGSMTALDTGDGELGGILAHYSTHHTPPGWLPIVFAEFERTLAPGGQVMLATHTGDGEHLRPAQAYGGRPVSYESYLLPSERIAELLGEAGLAVTARLDLAAGRRPGVAFLARKR
ncbi:class I SAM-dependent methyltransferase [Amycolatopsis alkalitolerans]|uniref:Class I SAM-dependent methyltransferase n=1 Tax=Amycolatopsis alkalitolerans TaxID=2547244 RepID=A0A5C4M7I3_9PSEU|nr:class I SAM-dependent methyltransferase [Amycolatopsis alkalitolerans]TNC27669.1 class I SAM-dependent methyltransferase [Amycolatopsis alkalitolerans]